MRTHTRRPRAGISAAFVARSYRDNCPCFSVSSLSPRVARVLLLFGCHAAVHDSPPSSRQRRAQEPSAKSHVLSITSTRNTSRCFSQRLVLTFSLRDHLPRIIFAFRWERHRSFEIAKREIRLVPRLISGLIVPGKSLRRVALKCNHEKCTHIGNHETYFITLRGIF